MKLDGFDGVTDEASRLLKAMANERRLLILYHLAHREHCVTELGSLIGLSQSALSQHLAKLRRDRLVSTRREAQTIYYSVHNKDVLTLLGTLHHCLVPQPAAAAAD